MKKILFCIVLGMSVFPVFATQQSELEISPGKFKTVKLPFDYKHMDEQEKNNTVFVPERFFTVLSDNLEKTAIVGPLQPCLFVGLRNEMNGKAVVFHKHFSNDIESLIALSRDILEIEDSNAIRGEIFTTTMGAYEQIQNGYFGLCTMKSNHKGRSQKQELKYVKDRIIDGFNILDRNQVRARIFTSQLSDFELGDYEFAELSIFVDSTLNLRNVCVLHENIFKNKISSILAQNSLPFKIFSSLPLGSRTGLTLQAMNQYKQEKTDQFFTGKVTEVELNIYGAVPFEQID